MRYLPRFILILLSLISFSIGFTSVRAADATVTDCTNFTGVGTISEAVADANTVAPVGGIITFDCSGTIIFANELTISANVTINSNGNTVIFDEAGNDNHFFVVNAGASLTLNGLTLQNGNGGNGGAINNAGTLTISTSTFTGNSATGFGGVIFNTGTLTITNSTFTGSVANRGGAIHNTGTATMTISTSTFMNNVANIGGAIDNTGTATINTSTFTGNLATNGGAINNDGGTLTISTSTFMNNGASNLGDAIANPGTTSSQDSHYDNNDCVGTITDNGGNTATNAIGCPGSAPIALDVSAIACNGDNAEFTINNGDANFDITGTGAGLDILDSPAGLITLTGPSTWANIRVTERLGDRQFVPLGDITCPATILLSASATCIGADLQVNIFAGDTPFDIVDNSTTLRDDVSAGTYLIPGPITAPICAWSNNLGMVKHSRWAILIVSSAKR